jgi:hypothetical protein
MGLFLVEWHADEPVRNDDRGPGRVAEGYGADGAVTDQRPETQ